MSHQDRIRWEARYQAGPSPRPARDSVLRLPAASPVRPFTAVDLACGSGRHCAALLDLGYNVVGLDIAHSGLQLARRRLNHAPGFLAVQADLDHWPLSEGSCDVVVQVDFLERSQLRPLFTTPKPGAILLLDTFLDFGHPNGEGPSNPQYLLQRGELAKWARGWTILECAETDGPTARGTLIARRPLR